MNNHLHLCLVLHNHQPIGNFEGVFQQAYQDSYRPFLEVFEDYPTLKLSLHTSGPLLLWLHQRQPDYVRRLSRLVAAGNIEIVGGALYEPILTMLPSRDRCGQIRAYSKLLAELLQTEVQGMWMPERVWESSLTSDLSRSGMQYTILDDFHFMAAGWSSEALTGYFLTENDGHLLRVFPGSEKLRYLIPFADIQETFDHLRQRADAHPGATLVFADDGEKFGSWPNTKAHVYEQGWLRRFFNALVENEEWIQTSTLSEVLQSQPPCGKIYLPECSYREMTEWAMPTEAQYRYRNTIDQHNQTHLWQTLQPWLRAGNWRNFKVKYSEANEMYSRMLQLSQKVQAASLRYGDSTLLDQARHHLYRGQCNCAYWHGAFGGIYLPHLRNAVYAELIAADNQLAQLEFGPGAWVESSCEDYNLDGYNEVRLANDQLALLVAPNAGGMIYELDVRRAEHNLLATMQRRPEVYHACITEFANRHQDDPSLASDPGSGNPDNGKCSQLPSHLQYDHYPRKSLLEHFFDNDLELQSLASGAAIERGDFVAAAFEAKLRRAVNKVQLQLTRDGNAWGIPLRLTKAVTLEAGSSSLDIAYLIEGLPQNRQLHLALEWNFAGLPAGADDRFFASEHEGRLGDLGNLLDLPSIDEIGVIDQWRGIDIHLRFNRPTRLWAFPIATVSQCEGGYESVHQSVCLMPHWLISGDREGRWSLQMSVQIGAERKMPMLPRLNDSSRQSVINLETYL